MILGLILLSIGVLILVFAKKIPKEDDSSIFTLTMLLSAIGGVCIGFYLIVKEIIQMF